jgi:hypothetical protein
MSESELLLVLAIPAAVLTAVIAVVALIVRQRGKEARGRRPDG